MLFPGSSSTKENYKQIINLNSSHSLRCPCYSRVTTVLLYPLNKPLNHHNTGDFKFTCICCDSCHHLQGVESCHDSSCLQVGRDFHLILTKVFPWGQACTVQWGRALHGDAKAVITLAQGSARLSHPLGEQSSSPCLLTGPAASCPVCSRPHWGPFCVLHALYPSAFRPGTLKCSQVVCQHLVWYKWLFN